PETYARVLSTAKRRRLNWIGSARSAESRAICCSHSRRSSVSPAVALTGLITGLARDQHSWSAASNHWQASLIPSCRFEERPSLEFIESLTELLLRVHHNGTIPGHRFLQRLARDQKKADALVTCLHGELVTSIKQNKRAIVSLRRGRCVRPSHSFG